MDTGTCSLRKRFRNGSCKSCPLLLTICSVLKSFGSVTITQSPRGAGTKACNSSVTLNGRHYATKAACKRLAPAAFTSLYMKRAAAPGSLVLGKGILRGLEFDAQGRAGELEVLAEPPFQEALVGIADVFERIAVDDDDRRVLATLVRIAQLGTEGAGALGLLELHGLLQQAREHRGGHLDGGRLPGRGDGLPQRAQALALD